MLVPGRTIAAMPSSMMAKRPAPCAASTAEPVEGASGEAGMRTGRPAVSAWICIHSGEAVAPPPTVISLLA